MISNRNRQEFIIHSIFRNIHTHIHTHTHSTMKFSCSYESIWKLCKLQCLQNCNRFLFYFFFFSISIVYSFCSPIFENCLPKIENWNNPFFGAVRKMRPAFRSIESNSQSSDKNSFKRQIQIWKNGQIFLPQGNCRNFLFRIAATVILSFEHYTKICIIYHTHNRRVEYA